MPNKSTWLIENKSDSYTQWGEDGIISKILAVLPKSQKNKWCVEVGAWDGIHFSNTRKLIEKDNYSAVLIEGDEKKALQLKKNYLNNKKVFPINQFVGFGKNDNLDKILAKTPISIDFDFLSIDIDGNDYHVWNAMKKYSPKVVCIEFNSTIPNEVRFVQNADPQISQGSSIRSLVELGREKGYELVSLTNTNAFFVKVEYFPLFKIKNNDIANLRLEDNVTYLFSGYDGKIFLRGYLKLPWHQFVLKETKFQKIPFFLRKHPANYTKLDKGLYGFYLFLRQPAELFEFLKRRSKPE